jgi:DNA polymerase-4
MASNDWRIIYEGSQAARWFIVQSMTNDRRIAHLDMDAFFASVELLRYPELRGQAVVVGGGNVYQPRQQADGSLVFARLREYAGRGVVTTSTYPARALGVFSGMGLMKSAKLAPEAILLPVNFEAYRHYSGLFKAAVARIAPQIEDRGIDEIYIDLSDHPETSDVLTKQLQQAVFDATGLTCSIGISPNKLLSKIASDLDKPNGISILGQEDIPARIWPLPASKVNGIGPRSVEKLAQLGISTIGELAAMPLEQLLVHFGQSTGHWMHRVAHGIDERSVVIESEPKSISRESTFERDLHATRDKLELSEIFTSLCTRVAYDLQRKGYACRTIGIKLRYADFRVVTRDMTLPVSICDGRKIRRAAGFCLKRVPLTQKIRLLGVRAGGLLPLTDGNADAGAIQAELPF